MLNLSNLQVAWSRQIKIHKAHYRINFSFNFIINKTILWIELSTIQVISPFYGQSILNCHFSTKFSYLSQKACAKIEYIVIVANLLAVMVLNKLVATGIWTGKMLEVAAQEYVAILKHINGRTQFGCVILTVIKQEALLQRIKLIKELTKPTFSSASLQCSANHCDQHNGEWLQTKRGN
jgi:hypothetical protein